MKKYTYLLVSLLSISFAENEISICAKHECPQEIKRFCLPVNDTIECLERINNGDITLGLAMPNEALLLSDLYPNLRIVAQLAPTPEVTSNWQHEIVIVVNRAVTSVLELQNFKYFHVGLEKFKLHSYIPNKFEQLIIENFKTDSCRDAPTLAERNICKLNEFFAPSCRRGSWVDYEEQKFAFIKDYPKLTQLCNSKASLEILNDSNGVVVVTTLDLIKSMGQFNFYYFWGNGMTSTDHYSWYQQSRPLILTSEENFSETRYKLDVWFANCKAFIDPPPDLINIERRTFPYDRKEVEPNCKNSFDTLLLPSNPRVLIEDKAEDVPLWQSKLNYFVEPLRWCTISKEETSKCSRIKLISDNMAYPIQCIEKQDKLACFKAIENKEADIVADKNPIAFVNLKPIATVEYLSKQVEDSKGSVTPTCLTKQTSNELIAEMHVVTCYQFIMRRHDPNIANAKVLLAGLKKEFIDKKENGSFDLFGSFKGTPNLLFESYTDNMSQFKLTMKDDLEAVSIETSTESSGTRNTNKTGSGPNLLVPIILILLWITIAMVAFVSRKFICKKKEVEVDDEEDMKRLQS